MSTIRIVIADDHRLFRKGLKQLLEMEEDFEVVGEAENGRQAVDIVSETLPDIVLMDISMPVLNGVAAARFIAETSPNVRVMILTMYRQDNLVFDAIKAGARGYLLKDMDEKKLISAIKAVHRGEAMIDPGMAARVLEEFSRLSRSLDQEKPYERLTKAEMDVLTFVAKGEDNRQIAKWLSISEKTVANRLMIIFSKLHVNNRTQAAITALRKGWVDLYDSQT